EFWQRAPGEGRSELVGGRMITMPPTGPTHGDVDSELNSALRQHVRRHNLGRVYTNTGFILRRNPDLVRGPDCAFVCAERRAAHPPPERGFWEIAPDLAVEIVSPDDTPAEIASKVRDYLAAGVRLVWVVNPPEHRVRAHTADGPVQTLGDG